MRKRMYLQLFEDGAGAGQDGERPAQSERPERKAAGGTAGGKPSGSGKAAGSTATGSCDRHVEMQLRCSCKRQILPGMRDKEAGTGACWIMEM